MITAMIVLIGIAVILLLLVVLGPVEQRPGFTQKPSTRFTDHNANGQWVLR
jgi:ABC-type transporter Mla subunit MlaD